MNFLVIIFVAVIAVKQLPSQSTISKENKDSKSIVVNTTSKKNTIKEIIKPKLQKQKVVQKIVKPKVQKQEIVQKIVKPKVQKQEIVQKIVKPKVQKQEIVQKIVKPEPQKQEKINTEVAKPNGLIEKVENDFFVYYLIGAILATIVGGYIYFRARRKTTLKEILISKEFNQAEQDFKPEPQAERSSSIEQTTQAEQAQTQQVTEEEKIATEELKPDSQPEESTTDEAKSNSQPGDEDEKNKS